MKVLHVIPSLWQGDGGPSHALRAMERALAAQGVTVETATTDDDGPGLRSGKAGQGAVLEEETVRRYFAKRSEFYKWSPGFARWISRAVTDYDLLHVHALFSFTTTAASQAARRAGVPYIVRPLGTLAPWGMEHRRPWLKRASLRMIETPLLRHAAAVHFTSDEEMREAAALRIDMRPVVIPLGIDMPPPVVRTPPGDGSVRALFLSRLHPKKNLDGLLDAMAMLRDEFPQLRLTIAGSGETEYESALRARADVLGLADRVSWLGFVEGAAKLRAFRDSDIFVLPSHSENFGIAAAEALAHGLPCVLSSGVAIARDVVAAAAGVEVATSAESIAAGLRLIMPPAVRAPMQASAVCLARERYSLGAMGTRLKQLYMDISGSRRGLPAKR
ncbi:MAG TPA: glycosyltransferase [Ramlibacter sp.]|nr:glycosyltransferase [Ramlibacter sp.]